MTQNLQQQGQPVLLVIPHYRHIECLQPFLKDLLETLPSHFAIRVSDDGSGEEVAGELGELVAANQRLFANSGMARLLDPVFGKTNEGKGSAVFRGWEKSGDFPIVAFVDADGAISASEILRADRFFQNMNPVVDVLFSSRVKMLGRTVVRKPHRHFIGRVFATIVDLLTGIDVYDSQCGFKILRQNVHQAIRPLRQSSGFAFDVEILLLCKKLGFPMVEFPIDWIDKSGSKVKLLSDPLKMLLDVARAKARIDRL